MIIKKKYTNIISKSESENNETEQIELPEEIAPEQTAAKEETSSEMPPPTEEESAQAKNNDFDLTLENIKFEQREERREGTRRRGYRRTQDRNIVSRAQTAAIAIKEAAKQEGYKEGIENAHKDIDELKQKFSEFFKYKDEIFDKVSGCILDISVEIAKKIIKKEVEQDSEPTLAIIREAVEEVNKTENKITLKVMPKDVEIVKDKVPEIFSDKYFEAAVSVIADNNIKEGGVIIETSNGIIDASISTQLSIIEKALCAQEEK